VLEARALEEAEVDFRTVLGDVSGSATEEAQFVVETALSLLRH